MGIDDFFKKKKEEEDLLPFFFVRAFLPKDINFPNLMQIYMHSRTFSW